MGANQSRPPTESSNTQEQPASIRLAFQQTFKYQALRQDLDCIRLIQIEPAQHNGDPLVCSLIQVTFADKPRYDALSYRWGDESTKYPISLNGGGMLVGKNLECALRYLRFHAPGTLFWIDALCINQGDTPERNRQLRIMAHIYFKASTVWVWLSNYTLPEYGWDSASRRAKLQEALCADEYWGRLWIIQEVQLARHKGRTHYTLNPRGPHISGPSYLRRSDPLGALNSATPSLKG
ncbi:heterokaryon incompatibility protein-domain-containing protein [Ilyonectria sp. MPI-CAGE-AT-0026]|nr:heterokaryon incompatibility protein-domain-containing protein [Ilyonectria sp. MPI-CAGE-AT-0026]